MPRKYLQITIEVPETPEPFEPAPETVKGLNINRMMLERDGDGLVRSIAAFIAEEKLDVSDAALLHLLTAIRKDSLLAD